MPGSVWMKCVAAVVLCLGMAASAQDGSGVYRAADFGAVGDGVSDATAAIQAALDAAAATGGEVRLDAGEYLVSGHLAVPEGVTLAGVNGGIMSIGQRKGTILLATGGRGDEDAPPLLHLTHASTVRGLTVYYPEQRCEDIVPYPWTFQLEGFDTTVEEVTLINSYSGIRTGPENNVRHRIRSVGGTVLRRGLYVDFCTDIGRVENVQFHCHWWSSPAFDGTWAPVYEYMWQNLEAFVFARTDWEYMTNSFVFPANVGWRFVKSERGACNGHLTGCGADSTQTALCVDAIQPMGLLVTGGQFVSFMGEEPVQVRVAPTSAGSVRFVNCAFWGPAHHNAIVEGTGFVSFSDCYFSSDLDATEGRPLLVARSGRLQVNNSTFATAQPSIELGEGVTHAIVRGNNAPLGLQVINRAPRTVIADNEDDPVQWSPEARAHYRLDVGAPGDGRYLAGWQGAEGAWMGEQGDTGRWSRGESRFRLPVNPGTAYRVTLAAGVPPEALNPACGLYLGEDCLIPLRETGAGNYEGTLPAQEGEEVTLVLRATGWVPAEHQPGSSDNRTLGMSVRGLTLRAQGAGARCFDANTGLWLDGATEGSDG